MGAPGADPRPVWGPAGPLLGWLTDRGSTEALNGAEAYAALSPGATPGTKLVCLNERYVRPGVYEVRFGTPVREICEELGGGLKDGRTIKVEQGDSLFIPGYLRHNEIRTSSEMEILEVSMPGELGTRPCDPPPGWKD